MDSTGDDTAELINVGGSGGISGVSWMAASMLRGNVAEVGLC